MSLKNSIKFLWECAVTLQPKTHTCKLVKSYYTNICRQMTTMTQYPLSKELLCSTQMCPKCGSLWKQNDFALKLRRQQITCNAKAYNLLKKFEKDQKNLERKNILSKKQKRRLKWLKKRMRNYIDIECQLCHNITQIPMHKPLPSQKCNKLEEKGLNFSKSNEKVNNEYQKTLTTMKTIKHIKVDNQSNDSQNQHYQIITTNVIANNGNKQSGNRIIKKQRLKQIQQESKKKAATKPTVPIQKYSKTQTKNSLVQLAALLKRKSAFGKNETLNKHLLTLLK